MTDENMGKITISLSKKAEDLLRKRAERNMRSISKEVEYLVVKVEETKIDMINPFYTEGDKMKKVK